MKIPKIIVAGVSTVALVGGIGAGLAYADTPSDEPTSSSDDDSAEQPRCNTRGRAHREACSERLPQATCSPPAAVHCPVAAW